MGLEAEGSRNRSVIRVALGIGSGEQLFTDKDGIGAGEETQSGSFARERAASGGEPHHHRNARTERWRAVAMVRASVSGSRILARCQLSGVLRHADQYD